MSNKLPTWNIILNLHANFVSFSRCVNINTQHKNQAKSKGIEPLALLTEALLAAARLGVAEDAWKASRAADVRLESLACKWKLEMLLILGIKHVSCVMCHVS